jgi:mono/diheme cytochrome c family protein
VLLIFTSFIFIGFLLIGFQPTAARSIDPQATPSPTPLIDRLATPVMPASPTPIDLGRMVYYMNCMPCHGDRGQGLTDEWRAVYEEDQNCWQRGCHGGREGDQGYPLPRTIPAVIGSPPILVRFQTSEALYDYLRTTHPPQKPGALSDDDYRNVTAFVWWASGRSMPGSDQPSTSIGLMIPIGLVVIVSIIFVLKRRRTENRSI